ncbi:DUF7662 domain-containing protein [Sphingobium sp. TomTYG45]
MAGKYDGLTEHLKANKLSEIVMTFAQIEEVIGSPLPAYAHRPQFWSNTVKLLHSQRKAIAAAHHEAFLISGSKRVRFKRVP